MCLRLSQLKFACIAQLFAAIVCSQTVSATGTKVTVVATMPLPDVNLPASAVAVPVQFADAASLENSGAIDLPDFFNRRLTSVYVNEVQGNPFQVDLNFRGYTASPLLGTPQGISVYLDGVRMNQPFGDVVSWDLIPRNAIAEMTLMPGSNPLFGLNTLGGALSVRTKTGRTAPGTSIRVGGGSYARRIGEFEHGGARQSIDWFASSSFFFDDGWRAASPSKIRQLFGRVSWKNQRSMFGFSSSYANNSLVGNGLQEARFLARDYYSVYSKPDRTDNRAPFFNANLSHTVTNRLNVTGNAYYRYIRTSTLNVDVNENSLNQSLYQPNAAERAALAAAGYSGFPASGANAGNTPFPFWRCIGQSLLRDEPGEKCNGLINRSGSTQHSYGLSGQLTRLDGNNQFTVGGAWDVGVADFRQSTQLGYLNRDRSVTGVNAYGDGVTGGNLDGVPFDTQVDLNGQTHTGSIFAAESISAKRWSLNISGRYNRTGIHNLDRIQPEIGSGSLSGNHVFARFNPSVGITFRPAESWNIYLSYSQGSRAPTSVELGCADPAQPCKLPNAMAGDPPLRQVVASSLEGGFRGEFQSRFNWSAGLFQGTNRDDILFVSSAASGFGYFKNFGKTRRQGAELSIQAKLPKVMIGGAYTLLAATFESPETVKGSSNSSNDTALSGARGLDGSISIVAGSRIPLAPRHLLKAYADLRPCKKFVVSVGLNAASSSLARGNENNRHEADGTYYLGQGWSSAYAVTSVGARYQVRRAIELFAQVNNLFDQRYYTAAQLGATGFSSNGDFIARPFAAVAGQYAVQHSTFLAPGAPRLVWGGARLRF